MAAGVRERRGQFGDADRHEHDPHEHAEAHASHEPAQGAFPEASANHGRPEKGRPGLSNKKKKKVYMENKDPIMELRGAKKRANNLTGSLVSTGYIGASVIPTYGAGIRVLLLGNFFVRHGLQGE